MKTIYKFRLNGENGRTKLLLPKNATLLTVQMQGDSPCLWVLLETAEKEVERDFKIFGTGFDMDELNDQPFSYIGTVQENDFVWHIFEVKP